MKGFEALADAVVQEGIDTVFVVLSEDSLLFTVDLTQNRGVRLISCRNERGAAAMADGYYRATGKLGVCIVSAGPGLTNATSSLTTANRNKSGVLCITTTPAPTTERYFPKTSDQRSIAEGTAGKYLRVRQQQTLAEDIQLAFRHVRSGAGPAVLSVPLDVMDAQLDMVWEYSTSAARLPGSHTVHPDPYLVNMAVDMLAVAKKPVILAGRGAMDAKADGEIKILAERTGALLATTLKAKRYMSDHPYMVGISGTIGEDVARTLLPESDCVLAVGARLGVYTTQFGFMFPGAKIIQIDKDAGRIGDITQVDLGIVGDARATVAAINACMEERQIAGRQGFWTPEVKSAIAASRVKSEIEYVMAPDTIDPRQLIAEMDRLLPEDRVVFLDGGHSMFFVQTGFPSPVITTGDFACVGMGLFQGLGAAVGRPDSHVVVFAGDGALMMSLEELDTAARYKIPITIVIMNDDSYSAEVRFLEARGYPTGIAFFSPLDFVAVAKSLGVPGFTVRNANDLKAAAAAIGKGDGPVLIDAKTNVNVVHETWQNRTSFATADGKKPVSVH
ncbi:MAG: thiamine pyrophosphate-binding protein [Dehalococcoidia bacterium]|nr:thiamine pyrophosphate-binding protein [Dehalococcoidia bacterium]